MKQTQSTPQKPRFTVIGFVDGIGETHHLIRADTKDEATTRFEAAYSKHAVTILTAKSDRAHPEEPEGAP